MINTRQGVWLLGILGFIMIILIGILIFVPAKKTPQPATNGIEITSPKPNETVSSPIKITGMVDGTNGWAGFEGQVGTVLLVADSSSPIGLASGILKVTTDWTKTPTEFEATLTFPSQYKGPATLSFRNENPSGDPAKDKTFILPVILQP